MVCGYKLYITILYFIPIASRYLPSPQFPPPTGMAQKGAPVGRHPPSRPHMPSLGTEWTNVNAVIKHCWALMCLMYSMIWRGSVCLFRFWGICLFPMRQIRYDPVTARSQQYIKTAWNHLYLVGFSWCYESCRHVQPLQAAQFSQWHLCAVYIWPVARTAQLYFHAFAQACLPLAVSVAFSEGSLLFATLRPRIRKSDCVLLEQSFCWIAFSMQKPSKQQVFNEIILSHWGYGRLSESCPHLLLLPWCLIMFDLCWLNIAESYPDISSILASEPSASARNLVRVPSKLPTNRVS